MTFNELAVNPRGPALVFSSPEYVTYLVFHPSDILYSRNDQVQLIFLFRGSSSPFFPANRKRCSCTFTFSFTTPCSCKYVNCFHFTVQLHLSSILRQSRELIKLNTVVTMVNLIWREISKHSMTSYCSPLCLLIVSSYRVAVDHQKSYSSCYFIKDGQFFHSQN